MRKKLNKLRYVTNTKREKIASLMREYEKVVTINAEIEKAEEILEERFHDIDRDTNSRGGQPDKERSKTKKEKNTNSSKKMSGINLYPDNWKVRRLER